MNHFHQKPTVLFLAISTILFSSIAHAQQTDDDNDETVVNLGTQTANIKLRTTRKTNEITGLGKISKQSRDIDQEMVLGIRDLTRYDPGISVVEQGRGATSGYAIRGVDKNRVAISVDGLSQAQSYLTRRTLAGSGSINEIEYENIKSIELSKGASSSEYGNGALGGAVGFVTKDPSDVLKDGQNWGVDTKSSYSSKNKQFTQSVSGAVKLGNFEQLAIYTHKEGEETHGHKAADDYVHHYQPLTGYFEEYRLNSSTPEVRNRGYYLVADDCPTLDCTPTIIASPNNNKTPIRTTPALTDKEQLQANSTRYPTHTASTKAYTGIDRIHANPMDQKSQSIFYKAGYDITPAHRVEGVAEYTKQRYDIQDMTLPAYYTQSDVDGQPSRLTQGSVNAETGLAVGNSGIPDVADNPLSGLVFNIGSSKYGARYSRTRYFDERHNKNRLGLSYHYTSPDKKGLIDHAQIQLDRQVIDLDSTVHLGRCNDYPNLDKCRASIDKPWSWYGSEQNNYQEKQLSLRLNFDKLFHLAGGRHKLSLSTGINDLRSILARQAMQVEYVSAGYDNIYHQGHNGSYEKPYIYQRVTPTLQTLSSCNESNGDNNSCQPRIIDGKQYHLAVRHHAHLNPYLDLGLGVRYDHHRFDSDDSWTVTDNYHNISYNAGINLRPTDNLVLSYRYANGFRVPSFYELYGDRVGASGKDNEYSNRGYTSRVAPKAEKSHNHEFGIGILGKFGQLETSVFYNQYKNLIARGDRSKAIIRITDFYNMQDISLQGVNVLGKLFWHDVSAKLPDGLYSTLAYNHIKVKKRQIYDGFTMTTDPILDAIQPARVVAGIGYDDPDGQWGFYHTLTYSQAKKADELTGNAYYGIYRVNLNSKTSKDWYTHDLTAYRRLGRHFTLRAGVYNLMNHKYSTWESVRQSGVNAVNQDFGTNTARYAAPGRNFVLTLESKF